MNELAEFEKRCFVCHEVKHVDEFRPTEISHLLRMVEAKGKCFRCFSCELLLEKDDDEC